MSDKQELVLVCAGYDRLPIGLKVLYSSTIVVLAVGYAFAMLHIFASHAGRDGNPMLSVQDLVIAYSGSASDTRLEAALKGPMMNMLPDTERHEIVAWVRRGADQAEFAQLEPIFASRCISCHDGRNPHIPSLKNYEDVSKVVQIDSGMDIFTLVRVSHIHLFGITFIFFILSSIFCHTRFERQWIKCLLIVTPFAMILFDIASWYLTKLFQPFAWVVLFSGMFMGLSFAAQSVISLYQMWILKPKNA